MQKRSVAAQIKKYGGRSAYREEMKRRRTMQKPKIKGFGGQELLTVKGLRK